VDIITWDKPTVMELEWKRIIKKLNITIHLQLWVGIYMLGIMLGH